MARQARHQLHAVTRSTGDIAWLPTAANAVGLDVPAATGLNVAIVDWNDVCCMSTAVTTRRRNMAALALQASFAQTIDAQVNGLAFTGVDGFYAVDLMLDAPELHDERARLAETTRLPLQERLHFTAGTLGYAVIAATKKAAFESRLLAMVPKTLTIDSVGQIEWLPAAQPIAEQPSPPQQTLLAH